MVSELYRQIRWQFLIFSRNNLILMIIGITLFYMLALYLIRDLGKPDKFTTLLIVTDPALIGFVFIGLSVILEKDQGVFSALFITPLDRHVYLFSKIITLSLICLVCSLAMVATAKGTAFDPFHFSAGAFLVCVLFSFVGIYVVSYTDEILHFILRSIPLIVVMSLPLLNYFELVDFAPFYFFPLQGSLFLIDNSYKASGDPLELAAGYGLLLIWIPLLYRLAYGAFRQKLSEGRSVT